MNLSFFLSIIGRALVEAAAKRAMHSALSAILADVDRDLPALGNQAGDLVETTIEDIVRRRTGEKDKKKIRAMSRMVRDVFDPVAQANHNKRG